MLNYTLYMVSPLAVEFVLLLIFKKSVNNSVKMRRMYIIIMGVIIALMIGLKSAKVGAGDSIIYLRNWDAMQKVPWWEIPKAFGKIDFEKGYLLFVWIFSNILRWNQFLFILYGGFVAFSICRILYLNAKDLVLSLVMFSSLGLFAFLVQGLRQGFAICICLIAVEFAQKRRPVLFFAFVVLAMFFHASAFVFAVVYFLPLLKMNISSGIIFGIIAVVGFFFVDRIYLLGNFFMNDSYVIGDTKDSGGGIITLVVYILILLFAIIFADKKEHKTRLFFYMTVCGALCFAMRFSYTTILQRVVHYFSIAEAILLSNVLMRFEKRQRLVFRYIIILLCYGIAFYKTSYSLLIPYLFFWQV